MPPALVATVPPTVALPRLAEVDPVGPAGGARPPPAGRPRQHAGPDRHLPGRASTSRSVSRRRLQTTSPASGTAPPDRPVLPPWQRERDAVAPAQRDDALDLLGRGRAHDGGRDPENRPVQSLAYGATTSGSVSTWVGPSSSDGVLQEAGVDGVHGPMVARPCGQRRCNPQLSTRRLKLNSPSVMNPAPKATITG